MENHESVWSYLDALKKKGMSEKEMLCAINATLPEEYQMNILEFRLMYNKVRHEHNLSNDTLDSNKSK